MVGLGLHWAPLRSQILLSISERPAAYTELYFSDYSALPSRLVAGRSYTVRYVLDSHGPAAQSVPVLVSVTYDGRTSQLSRQSLWLARGATTSASVTFTPPKTATLYFLTVSLPGDQSIVWRVPTG